MFLLRLSRVVLAAVMAYGVGVYSWGAPSPSPSPSPRPPKPPGKASELRTMRTPDVLRNLPVKLKGTLVCHDPVGGRLFVQDYSDAFGVGLSWNVAPDLKQILPSLAPGDVLEITGVTTSGIAAPFVAGSKENPVSVRVVGKAPLPAPLELGRTGKPSFQMHAVRTQLTGYVREVERRDGIRILRLLRGGEMTEVSVRDNPELEKTPSDDELIGSDVRVTGALNLTTSKETGLILARLAVHDFRSVEIIDPGLKAAFLRPTDNIYAARRFTYEDGTRVCFRGAVIGSVPGRILYLRVQRTGLRLRSPLLTKIEPGTVVDAAGFPVSRDGELYIEDVVVRPRDMEEPVTPVALRYGEEPEIKDDANLVRMNARLKNQLIRGGETVMLLEAGAFSFYARSLQDQPAKSWPGFEPDSLLELTGICDLSPASPSGGTFTLLLRDAADIRLVQPPPFWTPERLLVPGIVVLVSVLGTVAWNILLRRKVRKQTDLILQKVEGERIAEERGRIARELHDSLEQHLAGMAIQVDLAASRMKTSAERAVQSLEVVRALVRRGHEETRHAVWQLRSSAVARGDLAAALAEALEWQSPDLPVEIAVSGEKRTVPPTATHHLLRMAQEAVGNALKHGAPTRIDIHLDFGHEALSLTIQDNGRGFDPATVPEFTPGHFGLAGMRERLQKVGGEFQIESRPGAGTTIRATVPWTRLPVNGVELN